MKAIESRPASPLTIKQYEEINAGTDKNPALSHSDLQLPLVGLYGETGSLLTLFKKKWRDTKAYRHLAEDIVEEIGDLLWYMTNVSRRAGLSLEDIARKAFPELREFKPATGLAFSDLDRLIKYEDSVKSDDVIAGLVLLGDCSAKILIASASASTFKTELPPLLSAMLQALSGVCSITGATLNNAAVSNIKKTLDRWPIKEEDIALFDTKFNVHEQLPREFTVEFQEIKLGDKIYVYQNFDGVHVGDRLTDNIIDPDFYRFHDAFHWAYAAILGWSPVTRALLRCKRKSDPKLDENEDGARAGIIEEAIAVWIFHQAKDTDLFEGIDSLDFNILKAVRDLTVGFEAETIPLWLWERAILEGYKIFRDLKKYRNGFVDGNLNKRKISFRAS